jgi:hypothetical protein
MDPRVLAACWLQVDPAMVDLLWVGPNQTITVGPIQVITLSYHEGKEVGAQLGLDEEVQGVIGGPSLDHSDSREADHRRQHLLWIRLHQRRLCQRAPTPLESEDPD